MAINNNFRTGLYIVLVWWKRELGWEVMQSLVPSCLALLLDRGWARGLGSPSGWGKSDLASPGPVMLLPRGKEAKPGLLFYLDGSLG